MGNRKRLERRLNILKGGDVSTDKISNIELALREISEEEINFAIEKNPLFQHLNTERITPFFMKMMKGSKNLSTTNSIKDYHGRELANDFDRKTFIRNHFRSIYVKILTSLKI